MLAERDLQRSRWRERDRATTEDDPPRWYAGRTRARAEKVVHRVLGEHGIDSYLPLMERERRWADRRKKVEFPLFPGYLFVRSRRQGIGAVLATPGLVGVVRHGGEPSPVREDELEAVRILIEGARQTGELPTPADYLTVGDLVKVVEGPFAGLTGVLVEERARTRVAVRISAIRQAVSVDLDRRCLRPVG